MNPTAQQLQNRLDATGVTQEQLNNPSGNTTITADALQTPETPLTLPPTPAPRETGIANVEDLIAQAMAPDPLEAERRQAAETQANIIGGGSSADTRAQAQESAGFQDAKAGQLRAAGIVQRLQAEEDTLEERLQASVRGRGVTEGGLRPTRTAQQRDLAVRKRFAVADLLVAQGDFQAAQAEVNQAVNDEFADRENAVQAQQVRIDYLSGLADRNQIKLTNAQNIRLQERQRLINEESAKVAEEKADRRYTQNLAIQATQSGAPEDMARKMGESSVEEAIAIGAKYFGAEFARKADQQAYENGITTRTMQIREAEYAAKVRSDLLVRATAGDQAAIEQLGYDPTDLPNTFEEQQTFENEKIRIEGDLNRIQGALDNQVGIDASSGLVRGKLSIVGAALRIGGDVDERGLPTSLAFGPANAARVATKRNAFMSDARYIANNLTLNMVGELGERGIKLNPIANQELKLMGQASKAFVADGEWVDGELIGFTVSADKVTEDLTSVLEHFQRALDAVLVDMTMTEAEKREVVRLLTRQ